MSSDSTIRCLFSGRKATTSVGRSILRDMLTKLGVHYAFHSPSSCILPLHRLVTRKTVPVSAVSSQIHSVLHIGFLIKLFSRPCRVSLGRASGRMGYTRGRLMTLRTSGRSLILLGGRSTILPLSMGGVSGVTMYNPGTSRRTCTLARCNPLTMRIAAILRNVQGGMGPKASILFAGNYSLMSTG